jgi:hypothetical protein
MATTSIGSTGVTFPDATVQAEATTNIPILRAYVAPGTWTKPTGLKAIKVTVVGGGGNGGAVPSGPNGAGAGGGGGGSSIIIYPAASIPGPQPYTVGTAGNTTSFGGTVPVVSATGGAAGEVGSSASAGGIGGLGSGGTINMRGSAGDGGQSPATSIGPRGGSSFMGGFSEMKKNPSPTGTVAGAAGSQYGGGGGGSFKGTNPGPTTAGGAGATGVIMVEEFY